MRKGRAFFILDRGKKHTLKVVPVEPKGYAIFRDDKLAYGGLIFSNEAKAMAVIDRVKRSLSEGIDSFFNELSNVKVLPIERPGSTYSCLDEKVEDGFIEYEERREKGMALNDVKALPASSEAEPKALSEAELARRAVEARKGGDLKAAPLEQGGKDEIQ